MINTKKPLEEKMALFWHHLFATGFAKLNHPGNMLQQIAMFRKHGLGDFRDLLVELSKDPPAMIFWLDNQTNTTAVHNENWGRELLELFALGIGNYTEDDVKNCARAFTGLDAEEPDPRRAAVRAPQLAVRVPPGPARLRQKTFLGETGNWDGADIVDIIVKQPACAQFVAKRLHNYFVSDVPDQEAIDELADVFTASQYDIRGHADAVHVGRLPLGERVLRARQEPGRARRRDPAAGRRLHLPAVGHPRGGARVPGMGQDL